jgi:hypothetical protein
VLLVFGGGGVGEPGVVFLSFGEVEVRCSRLAGTAEGSCSDCVRPFVLVLVLAPRNLARTPYSKVK